jgi:hypothetical protein
MTYENADATLEAAADLSATPACAHHGNTPASSIAGVSAAPTCAHHGGAIASAQAGLAGLGCECAYTTPGQVGGLGAAGRRGRHGAPAAVGAAATSAISRAYHRAVVGLLSIAASAPAPVAGYHAVSAPTATAGVAMDPTWRESAASARGTIGVASRVKPPTLTGYRPPGPWRF